MEQRGAQHGGDWISRGLVVGVLGTPGAGGSLWTNRALAGGLWVGGERGGDGARTFSERVGGQDATTRLPSGTMGLSMRCDRTPKPEAG